jgi:hypothetical protein
MIGRYNEYDRWCEPEIEMFFDDLDFMMNALDTE